MQTAVGVIGKGAFVDNRSCQRTAGQINVSRTAGVVGDSAGGMVAVGQSIVERTAVGDIAGQRTAVEIGGDRTAGVVGDIAGQRTAVEING